MIHIILQIFLVNFGEIMRNIIVRLAEARDWEAAIGVAWVTFQQVAAQVSSEEGARDFRDGLTSTKLYMDFLQGKYPVFCACEGKRIVGMLALRDMEHISLFFVKKEFQGRGIGRSLLEACRAYCRAHGISELTVNAAPTGISFYLANGFRAITGECFEGGLRFTPMTVKA